MLDTESRRVAIVGAGPAGLATALALRQQDARLGIVVLDRPGPGPRPGRAGETLPPTTEPLLRRLGLWSAFLGDAHLPNYGSLAAWGGSGLGVNEYIHHPYQRGWHVDRTRFDATLARHAQARGIELISPAALVEARRRGDDRWELKVETGGATGRSARWFDADFVVDATGRHAGVARRQGVRRQLSDRLVAAIVVFQTLDDLPEYNRRSLVEATEHGWWSVAGLPGARQIAAFMTDQDLARSLGVRSEEHWHALLERTVHLRARLSGATPLGPPAIQAAQSGCLDCAAGLGWLAVGDAASTFDPLSSMGIFKALRSAVLASYAIRDALAGKEGGGAKYAALMKAEYVAFLRARQDFYARESRWSVAPFWRRRRPDGIVERRWLPRRGTGADSQLLFGRRPQRPMSRLS